MGESKQGRAAISNGWMPLSDVWLGIATAVVTALLVNVVSSFRVEWMPILEVCILLIASGLVGRYAGHKARALKQIEETITQKQLFGPEKALERKKVRDEAFADLKPLVRGRMGVLAGCLVVATGLLVGQGWLDRKAADSGAAYRVRLESRIDSVRAALGDIAEQLRALSARVETFRLPGTVEPEAQPNEGGSIEGSHNMGCRPDEGVPLEGYEESR